MMHAKLRKTLAILAAICLLLAMAAGCGSSDGQGSSPPQDDTSPSASQPPDSGAPSGDNGRDDNMSPAGGSTIKPYDSKGVYDTAEYVYPLDNNSELSYFKIIFSDFQQAIGKDYGELDSVAELERKTGVHVKWTVVSQLSAQEAVTAMVAGGDYPDILESCAAYFTGGYPTLLAEDIIIDLTPYVEDYLPNYYAAVNSGDYNAADFVTDDSRFLCIQQPNLAGWPATTGAIVRQDWLDQLNMEQPVTYDDWYNMLTAFKVEMGCSSPLFVDYNGIPEYYLSAGFDTVITCPERGNSALYQIDGVVRFGPLESDKWVPFMEMYSQWYAEGLIHSDFMTENDNNVIVSNFASDRIGVAFFKSFVFSRAADLAENPDFNLQPMPDARMSENQQLHLMTRVDLVDGMVNSAISTNCKDIITACRWIDYQFAEEGRLFSNWGVEGVSYEIGGDGAPHTTDLIRNNTEGFSANAILARYATMLVSVQDYRASTTEEIQFIASEVWQENSDQDYTLPSTITMTTEESREYASLYGDIKTLVSEYTSGVIMGSRSLDEYEQFVADLESLGIERVMELMQAALDRYNDREITS